MRGFITGVVLGLVIMIPFAIVAATFENGQDVVVCIHEGEMSIVKTTEECQGDAHQGTIKEVSDLHVDVQVGEQVVRVPVMQ
ncbi:MAG: hypothetical protein EA399_08025 [Desulfovibrionales bacterium]|nr:MAG: hypothetical protein EA399_08025 [Desulfovibrionales bacterium]